MKNENLAAFARGLKLRAANFEKSGQPIIGQVVLAVAKDLSAVLDLDEALSTELLRQASNSARIADAGMAALSLITEALDGDCDATRVALYNPIATITKIREILAQAGKAALGEG